MALTQVQAEMIGAGGVVQLVNAMTSAVATGTTILPYDDTIPQNTEGDQYLTVSITPKSATNKLYIRAVIFGYHTITSDFMCAALFQDSTAGALSASVERTDSVGSKAIIIDYYMTTGTTSATTFKIRAGGNSAGTFTLNGSAGSRRFGGVNNSSLTVMEIAA